MLQTTRQTQHENVQSRFTSSFGVSLSEITIPDDISAPAKKYIERLLRWTRNDIADLKNTRPGTDKYEQLTSLITTSIQLIADTILSDELAKERIIASQNCDRRKCALKYQEEQFHLKNPGYDWWRI